MIEAVGGDGNLNSVNHFGPREIRVRDPPRLRTRGAMAWFLLDHNIFSCFSE